MLFLGRLIIYMVGYASPRPMWARLATGKLFAPAYDYAWITPIVTLLVAAMLTGGVEMAQRNFRPVLFGISIAILITVVCGGGPGLLEWRLTGGHRIVRQAEAQSRRRQRGASPI
jgi:hypothetical protein